MTNPLQSIQTPDLLQERLARLKAEFPDLFTNEGKLNPVELQRLTQEEGRERFDFSWWGKAAAKRKGAKGGKGKATAKQGAKSDTKQAGKNKKSKSDTQMAKK